MMKGNIGDRTGRSMKIPAMGKMGGAGGVDGGRACLVGGTFWFVYWNHDTFKYVFHERSDYLGVLGSRPYSESGNEARVVAELVAIDPNEIGMENY